MQDFRRLSVLQKAHALALAVYRESAILPEAEKFGLTSQMRRSACSVPANIAEGCGRETRRDLSNFLNIAAGSLSELEYQLLLARDLGFLSDVSHHKLEADAVEVRRMLAGFLRTIKRSSAPSESEGPGQSKLRVVRKLN